MLRRTLSCLAALASACSDPSPTTLDARDGSTVNDLPDATPDARDGSATNDLPDATPASALRADPDITAAVATVSTDEVARSIATLVGFESRNTCSSLTDAARGIGAARDWILARFAAMPGVQTRTHEYNFTECTDGATRESNVLAWIPGTTHPERLIVIGGHYDSLGSASATGVIDGTIPAPGANDSGSQTAVLLEAARALAGRAFDATLVFVAFSGEEQGTFGSHAFVHDLPMLFPDAQAVAMLNCDIVGGDRDANDDAALHRFRLYSAGTPRESGGLVTQIPERQGSADDTSPARGLMRYVGAWGALYVPAMTMLPHLREDRPGRGGDQSSFLAARIPAVRFVETNENPSHQHVPDDVLANVSPAYAARVAQVVAAVAASLARAPAAPEIQSVTRDGDAITLTWSSAGASARTVLLARPVSRNEYMSRIVVTGDAVEVRAPVSSLGVASEAFFVSVAVEDEAGHQSLPAYPEWRCDDAGCEVQAGSLAVTTTRAL